MNDIVERLRNYRPFNHFRDGPLVSEAAGEIERLRREVQEARAVLRDLVLAWEADIDFAHIVKAAREALKDPTP